ncbi:peptidoglycan DD-metalloendopeptidase family protein [bacterium]|nr:peptidoglycan DD-metalloendopeptidase family protein [bacterium]
MRHLQRFFLATLIAVIFVIPLLHYAEADPRSELKEKKSQLASQRKRLDIINDREKDLSAQLNNTQYDLQESRIVYHETLASLKSSQEHLKNIKTHLKKVTDEFKGQQKVLGKRLREIYMHGDVGYLVVLLGSQSFTDFIDQTRFLSLIIQNDRNLLNKVKALKDELENKKLQEEETIREIESLKKRQLEKIENLKKIESKRTQLLADVRSQRDSLNAQVSELENSTFSLEKRIQNEINSHRTYMRPSSPQATRRVWGTGRFITPAPGPITSPFGYRVHPIFGTLRFHTGVDIGAPYGCSILAADSGTVIDSGWMGGYGNCLIVDHGGGYSTLYAHCSQLYVGYGQGVTKGQAIAAVGSTGNSTGPHLHFEVRINGEPVDPLGFI